MQSGRPSLTSEKSSLLDKSLYIATSHAKFPGRDTAALYLSLCLLM